ncbi:MAG: hypothetical protein P0Y52_02970 [Candidatus Brevundimonas phytovorans]|nr:hypothetical protein [Brevundimonas sp.]WEK58518.1 MAG: hypothetical protein P0Y52_02970 [Brevundimonas sp.]
MIATITAYLIGVGGSLLAVGNLPFGALSAGTPPPAYVWMNMLVGAIMPAALSIALATGLLLVARVDRRLEQLEFKVRQS